MKKYQYKLFSKLDLNGNELYKILRRPFGSLCGWEDYPDVFTPQYYEEGRAKEIIRNSVNIDNYIPKEIFID